MTDREIITGLKIDRTKLEVREELRKSQLELLNCLRCCSAWITEAKKKSEDCTGSDIISEQFEKIINMLDEVQDNCFIEFGNVKDIKRFEDEMEENENGNKL